MLTHIGTGTTLVCVPPYPTNQVFRVTLQYVELSGNNLARRRWVWRCGRCGLLLRFRHDGHFNVTGEQS